MDTLVAALFRPGKGKDVSSHPNTCWFSAGNEGMTPINQLLSFPFISQVHSQTLGHFPTEHQQEQCVCMNKPHVQFINSGVSNWV